jgi:hypothetical protein
MSCYLGLDVAQASVVLASEPVGHTGQFATDPAGLAALVAACQAQPVTLMVLEATGGDEAPVAAALATAGLPVTIVNPRQVRAFAQALGRLAKTDRVDAEVLARFAARVRPTPRPLPDAATQELEALLARRRQLLEMLHAERQRLPRARGREVRRNLRAHIRWLEHGGIDADAELERLIQQSPVWRVQDELLQSVPGVGPMLARTARAGAGAPAGAAALPCGRCSTWPRSRRPGTIRCSARSISGCAPPASPRRSPSRRSTANCSCCSTPSCATSARGAMPDPRRRRAQPRQLLAALGMTSSAGYVPRARRPDPILRTSR